VGKDRECSFTGGNRKKLRISQKFRARTQSCKEDKFLLRGQQNFIFKILYPCSFSLFALMLKISVKQIKLLAILWHVFITVLFFLPGSAFPKENWLADIHLDKWVHFGFFALLVLFWRYYFPEVSKYSWLLLMLAFCYGLSVEIIQHFFVANRSFDAGDIIADMVGSLAGLWVWTRGYIKK